MTDRELLEIAAKAAGIAHVTPMMVEWGKWNPLTDDGDALRLAVKMELSVDYSMRDPTSRKMATVCVRSDSVVVVYEVLGTDPCAATRRAIVRAAAEIGRAMK